MLQNGDFVWNKFIHAICCVHLHARVALLHLNDLMREKKKILNNHSKMQCTLALVRPFDSAMKRSKNWMCDDRMAWPWYNLNLQPNSSYECSFVCSLLLLLFFVVFYVPNIFSCAHLIRHRFRWLPFVLICFVSFVFFASSHTNIQTSRALQISNSSKVHSKISRRMLLTSLGTWIPHIYVQLYRRES